MTTTKFPPILFNPHEVALMVEIVMLYHIDSIQDDTGHSRRELRDIAAQKMPPTQAVLRYFRLKLRGSIYIWKPELEWKSNPCWGPCLRKPTAEVRASGQAIHAAVRTVESSFTTGPPQYAR
jgi:hypothetical protein